MRLSVSLLLGLRFSRKHRMLSISNMGIAIGVAVLIIGLSAMNGFERELRNRILAVVPHGEIEPFNHQQLFNWERMITTIEKIPGIKIATPYINFTAIIDKGTKIHILQIKGIDLKHKTYFNSLSNFIIGNNWQFIEGKQQILLGAGISKTLQVKPGDWITIFIQGDENSNHSIFNRPKSIRLQVTGIIQIHSILDYNLALIPLMDAQRYLKIGNNITGITVIMNNPFQAQSLVRKAANVTQSDVYIRNWINTYGYMYQDIQMIRAIIYLAMFLVIGVACFNIVSTLVIEVKKKSKDIAILRTLGANDHLIRNIFIWYGLLSGLLGSTLGILFGVVISLNLTTIMHKIEHVIGYQILSKDIYFIDFFPSKLYWVDLIYVLTIAIILSIMASWYPSRRARLIDPARMLSGGLN
ncbi:lipoprotein-releasing ABC transporter permease subunit LolE [Pantoea sp. Aalb]|uniref:lipoprotein-releasing ABC transporter permease subunit LolE n=1 Tax=Pantoea sp. Aalb TaxID=2576762 RepID=UPI00132B26BF|nr:lipoprotein-releasing ABC transporter permease subunit LolE [Pantoea sp. Aalb]MXP67452.1 lipoprotein-releasing ABC transporter permease subunit LolE [Pantoea sp. Aalb]